MLERRQLPFLGAHLLRGVVRSGQRKSQRQRVADSDRQLGLIEQRRSGLVAGDDTPRGAPQTGQPGAEHAVAAAQMVIEKAERTPVSESGKSQRQAGELNGHRIEIDPEQAALGNQPPDLGALL
jgi:hypothetical protein